MPEGNDMMLGPPPEFSDDDPEDFLKETAVTRTTAERNKKILMDLAVEGKTMVPVGIGTTVLLGTWAVAGGIQGFFLGFALILAGLGVACTKVLFGWDVMVNSYEAAEERSRAAEKKRQIDALNTRMKQRGDTEGHVLLVEVRSLYEAFQSNINEREEEYIRAGIVGKVERLFDASIEYLRRAYELRKTANKLRGDSRDKIMVKRQEMLTEVEKSVAQLAETVQQTEGLTLDHDHGRLDRLRQSLDEQLEINRSVAESMSEVDDLLRDAS